MDLWENFFFAAILGFCCDQNQAANLFSEENQLIDSLLANRSKIGKFGRPVFNMSETLSVSFGVVLIQILNLDEKAQVITLKILQSYVWRDKFLVWNPEEHHGVDKVNIPISEMWLPDIALINSVKKLEKFTAETVVVSSDGRILWVPEVVVAASCPMDMTYFPNDIHNCTLTYMLWLYHSGLMELDFYNNQQEIELDQLVTSNEWKILDTPVRRTKSKYPCCVEEYTYLHFSLIIKRTPAFYNFVMVYPSVLLSTLTPLMFMTPPSSHDRNSYAIGIFGAFFLLLLIVADAIPRALTSVPVFGFYLLFNMALVVLAMFLSTFTTAVYTYSDEKPMAKWLRLIIHKLGGTQCPSATPSSSSTKNSNTPDVDVALNKTGAQENHIKPAISQKQNKDGNNWKLLSQIMDRMLFIVYILLDVVLVVVFIILP